MNTLKRIVISAFWFGFLFALSSLIFLGVDKKTFHWVPLIYFSNICLIVWVIYITTWKKFGSAAGKEEKTQNGPATDANQLSRSQNILFYIALGGFVVFGIGRLNHYQQTKNYDVGRTATHAENCNVFKDNEKRDTCLLTYISYNRQIDENVSICDKIESTGNKDTCLMFMAEKLKDRSICAKIQDAYIKSNCPSRVVQN